MIYLLTAIGLPSGGSSTVHIYTQTIHGMTQNKQYTEQHNNFGRVRAVPRLGEFYPGICLTTEEKARKNLSQGRKTSARVAESRPLCSYFKKNSTLLVSLFTTFIYLSQQFSSNKKRYMFRPQTNLTQNTCIITSSR